MLWHRIARLSCSGRNPSPVGWTGIPARAERNRIRCTILADHGGERAWFLCPAEGCGRRVARLYVGGAGIFACRYCYGLAYACQRESADDRGARRADKIRDRLGWEPGILNGPGGKPKGMHWRTFDRLTAQHEAFVGISLAWMATPLRLLERLGVVGRPSNNTVPGSWGRLGWHRRPRLPSFRRRRPAVGAGRRPERVSKSLS
jgi:hypothetical protein